MNEKAVVTTHALTHGKVAPNGGPVVLYALA